MTRARLVTLHSMVTLIAAAAPYGAQLSVNPAPSRPNLLFILADDVGVDRVGAYAEHPAPGRTPVIDGLAAEGVMFRNAWSNPTCSPTRATVLTGLYPFRTGVGHALDYEDATHELDASFATLPGLLRGEYRTAVVGKWHLGIESGLGPAHPLELGFQHHYGSMSNLPSYFSYEKNIDGALAHSPIYATTDSVDDAIGLIASFQDQGHLQPHHPRPWFVWLAFNAAHGPFEPPPPGLYTLEPAPGVPNLQRAMVEAMDTEIGRLLDSLSPATRSNTIIVFAADNGTDPAATTAPFSPEHAKPTVYEGGINVPLIVSGPGVAQGAECDALVGLVDLFATFVELGRVTQFGGDDSVSLVPYLSEPSLPSLRDWVYAERFVPSGPGPYVQWRRAIREDRYKLRQFYDATSKATLESEFFDLWNDPFEQMNLLDVGLDPEQESVIDQLRTVLMGLGPQ